MPLDLSFSCWFFFVLSKVMLMFTTMTGWQSRPRVPFYDEQAFGAFLCICIMGALGWAKTSDIRVSKCTRQTQNRRFNRADVLPTRVLGDDWRIHLPSPFHSKNRDGVLANMPTICHLLRPLTCSHPATRRIRVSSPQPLARDPLLYPHPNDRDIQHRPEKFDHFLALSLV